MTDEHLITLEFDMKKLAIAGLSLTILASTSVLAQERTRAAVTQEMVQAEQNGENFRADKPYPPAEVNHSATQVQTGQPGDTSYGGSRGGSSASGSRMGIGGAGRNACVGPRGFCDIYAGGS